MPVLLFSFILKETPPTHLNTGGHITSKMHISKCLLTKTGVDGKQTVVAVFDCRRCQRGGILCCVVPVNKVFKLTSVIVRGARIEDTAHWTVNFAYGRTRVRTCSFAVVALTHTL